MQVLTRGFENAGFPGPFHIPHSNSKQSLHFDYSLSGSLPDLLTPPPTKEVSKPQWFPHANVKRHRRTSSKRDGTLKFKTTSSALTFTDTWHNRYSSKVYMQSSVVEQGEDMDMDVDPPVYACAPPKTPPGLAPTPRRDHVASQVAVILLGRSESMRKRTYHWQRKPSRLCQELRLV